MHGNRKIVVVMPAYNAVQTLLATHQEVLAQGVVDEVIVVDDASRDATVELARTLPRTRVAVHPRNRGYGGNQKTCYRLALEAGADIVVMVHPDYQYTPRLIPAMAALISSGLYHCVLGSRILGGYALRGGMPAWKYVANRGLTLFTNVVLPAKLSEYHTGFRAFSRELLERVPWNENDDDFVFDGQMLAQVLWMGYVVAEITCPTRYGPASSSIGFARSVRYGLGCVATALRYRIAAWGWGADRRFPAALRGVARPAG